MQKKLLIFGGGGFVGGNLAKKAQRDGWEVHIADSCFKSGFNGMGWHIIDIIDQKDVGEIVKELIPDAIINLAAIADIDKAENKKELAWNINVCSAVNLAKVCKQNKIKYVFLSSDAVFDGKSQDYKEESDGNPLNYYGKTKAEAEKKIRDENPDSIIIRISLVLGFPVANGNALYANIADKIKNGKEIICPLDEYRTPVDVITLSESILELIKLNYSGIIHIGSTESINRYQLAKQIVEMMGFDGNLVKPQKSSNEISDRAPRHKNGIISTLKAQKLLKTKMLNINESLAKSFNERF